MSKVQTDSYYRHLCNHLGVAVVATDADLKIRTWNQAATRMFGASEELMSGTPVQSIFPQTHRRRCRELIERAFQSGEITSTEYDQRDDHGQFQELIATFAPIVSDSGDRIGASVSIRDITHRIAVQREPERLPTTSTINSAASSRARISRRKARTRPS